MYIRCIITLYTILSTKMDRPSRRFRAVQTSQLQRITLSVQVERDVDSRFFLLYIYIYCFFSLSSWYCEKYFLKIQQIPHSRTTQNLKSIQIQTIQTELFV